MGDGLREVSLLQRVSRMNGIGPTFSEFKTRNMLAFAAVSGLYYIISYLL